MDWAWTLIIMLICLLLEGFFSGSEIALISADQMKLRHDAAKGSRGARLALRMLKKPEWLLSTTLVGTNVSVVANTTLAAGLAISLFGEQNSWIAIVVAAPLIWIFGEIVPKSVFQHRADTLTPRVVFFLRVASYAFYPILIVFSLLTRLGNRVFGGQSQNPFTLREEIITMLQLPAKDGDIQHVEKDMISRVFSFSETTADCVMVPLIDVVAIDQRATCGEAVRVAAENAHVRLPVYADRVDRVVGVLNTLELLGEDPSRPITSYIRPVRYVPGSKGIRELLLDLRQDGDTVAVVVDEYGGAEGLVTIEDVMEEVVEEMEDEYDSKESSQQWVRKVADRDYIVSARIEVDNLEEKLHIVIPRGKYVTLAGFLLERAREVPSVGSVIKADGISYTIQKGTPRTIQEVRVRW
ncbi:MAG: hemolysin family protein [Thermodesulfobacteriota bacterium]